MPKRTLSFKRVRRHFRGPQKDTPLTDFDGVDLLHLFKAWAKKQTTGDLSDTAKRHLLRITHVRSRGRWVFVEAESGYYGEGGNTIDVDTDTVVHKRKAAHAAAEFTRLLFFVPPGSTSAFFAAERSGAQSAGARIVDKFKIDLIPLFGDQEYTFETVVESSAWNDGAQLLSVTAVAHGFPVDIADGTQVVPSFEGKLEQTLVPENGMGKYLPRLMMQRLRAGAIHASEFMAFPDGVDIEETIVEVENNGQTKKYHVDKESVPATRLHLNEANENALTDTEFITKCLDEMQDWRELEGATWEESWRTGKWSGAAKGVTFPSAAQ